MAQVRQAVSEYCLLPLGSKYVQEKAPFTKAVCLYGVPSTGKTLLTHAVANSTGATFFNISPRNTDGKYPGKAVALMLHMVFKIAKVMKPSIVYIDECEKVFIADKKKQREFGGQDSFARIKKDLLKEMKQVQPGDQVLVMGNSSTPYLCVKKDEKAFLGFWDKIIHLPVPNYDSLQRLWPMIMERYGAKIDHTFDLSTLAHVSSGYSAGTIDRVCQSLLKPRRIQKLKEKPLTVNEIIYTFSKFEPVQQEALQAIAEWSVKLEPKRDKDADGKKK